MSPDPDNYRALAAQQAAASSSKPKGAVKRSGSDRTVTAEAAGAVIPAEVVQPHQQDMRARWMVLACS